MELEVSVKLKVNIKDLEAIVNEIGNLWRFPMANLSIYGANKKPSRDSS